MACGRDTMLDLDLAIVEGYSARVFLIVQLPRGGELAEDRANA
jgi:hypothetical protein